MPKVYYKRLLEIACFSMESCVIAQNAGADRVEFCADYSLGGVTPTHADILKARQLLSIPLHIIIRPRGGNFVYTDKELNEMKNDILFCKNNNIDGVVFGVLDSENKINLKENKKLLDSSNTMATTFHRAIDVCDDMEESYNNLISLGFRNVLTSGGKKNASEGAKELKLYHEKFGSKITVIPGGGVRSTTIESLLNETGCTIFHSAALNNSTQQIDSNEIKHLKEKLF